MAWPCSHRHSWELSEARAVALVSDGEILCSLLSKSTGITACRFSWLPLATNSVRDSGGGSLLFWESGLPITALLTKAEGVLKIPGKLQLKAKVRLTLMTQQRGHPRGNNTPTHTSAHAHAKWIFSCWYCKTASIHSSLHHNHHVWKLYQLTKTDMGVGMWGLYDNFHKFSKQPTLWLWFESKKWD